MDHHRRLTRSVIDPKVRQVGFFTPGEPPSPTSAAASPPYASLSVGSSLSPVMIIPPRPSAAAPIPVPYPNPNPNGNHDDPSDSLSPETTTASPSSSPSRRIFGGSEFSEEIDSVPGKLAASLPAISRETVAMRVGSLTTASGAKLPPELLERAGGSFTGTHSKELGSSRPMKERTTKADRRAIQEAQRASKASARESGGMPASIRQGKSTGPTSQKKDGIQMKVALVASEKKVVDRHPEKDRKKDLPQPRMQFDDKHRVDKAKRRAVVNQSETRNIVELFRHLPQYVHGTQLPDLESKFFQLEPVHPSVYKVGLQYLSGNICGGNARCIAMLLAFREAIKDYTTPSEKILNRDLAAKINSYVSFLIECRPISISMGNAIKFLKNRIANVPPNLSDSEEKFNLQSDIIRFINEKIVLADNVIVRHAVTKIRDGDVLLTYGSPCVVEMILLYAHELGKQFRVVVVDSRPKLEGKALVRRLVVKGISCTYTHINAISYIMHEVTRIFLGASSVLANGTVYSRVGTACVAMVAHAFDVPVLICCEAYKFHERVQLDSICSNELGDPDLISKENERKALNHVDTWAGHENLQLLNLIYDVTPCDFVSVIVTDYGMIPPTSVPVIVREYRRENLWM